MAYAIDHTVEIETTSDEPPLIRASHDQTIKSSWMELDDIVLKPCLLSTTYALLKLRTIILFRDLQRLYLMILVPLLCCGVGLYLNSIQVVLPTVRSIELSNETYGENSRIVVVGGKKRKIKFKFFWRVS